MRTSRRLNVSEDDRKELERLVRATKSEQRLVLRARIVLLSGEGVGTGEICERLQTTVPTVTRWRTRYQEGGVQGLCQDAQRSGRPATISGAKVAEIIHKTTQEKPEGETHWSTRTLAPVVGVSAATVRANLGESRAETASGEAVQGSSDPNFVEKLEDCAGGIPQPPREGHFLLRWTRRARSKRSTGRSPACR